MGNGAGELNVNQKGDCRIILLIIADINHSGLNLDLSNTMEMG